MAFDNDTRIIAGFQHLLGFFAHTIATSLSLVVTRSNDKCLLVVIVVSGVLSHLTNILLTSAD